MDASDNSDSSRISVLMFTQRRFHNKQLRTRPSRSSARNKRLSKSEYANKINTARLSFRFF